MNKNNCRVVVNGEICPGAKIDSVKEKMAKLFKLTDEQVNTLFSGKRQVVKKNIDNDSARKYKDAIENTGAVCLIEIEEVDISGLSLKVEQIEEKEKEPEKAAVCPKCGYEAQNDNDPLVTAHGGLGECPMCGIIVSKYLAENPPVEEEKSEEETDSAPMGYPDEHIID